MGMIRICLGDKSKFGKGWTLLNSYIECTFSSASQFLLIRSLIYSRLLKFHRVPIFVVFVEGPIHEFQYPRNCNFLYELWKKYYVHDYLTPRMCHFYTPIFRRDNIMVWWCLSVRPDPGPSIRLSVRLPGSPSASFYTPVFRRDVLWYGDVRPSVRPTLRPGLRPPVFRTFLIHALTYIELKFCTWLGFNVLQIKFECHHFASIFEGVMPLCELRIIGNVPFSALFSDMLWHIELKFCIWLCFTVLQIKFECRQFPSILVGVMPLLECRILKIQFSTLFFYTLWLIELKFTFHFVLLYYRSSSSVVNLRQFL